MAAREQRAREARILDEAARYRRQKKALEALEQDNFQDEPHADLVMSKKAPKFEESLDQTRGGSGKKKKRKAEFYKQKYGKNFHQHMEEQLVNNPPDAPNYMSAEAQPSREPKRHFCTVCGFPAPYTCVQCGVKFCSSKCLSTHRDTRCLKWTA